MKRKIRYIFNNKKLNDFNRADEKEMDSTFHRTNEEFELKEKLFRHLSSEISTTSIDPSELKVLFYNIWVKIVRKKLREKTIVISFKFAAVLIIGLVIGTLINKFEQSTIPEPVYYSTVAPIGSVSELILPDSTVIYLNAGSKIKYSIDGKNGAREVFLDGEAWFDVKKNNEKHFIVHTSFYTINVTGTQFNVKAYESDNIIATTLEEGQIIIQSTESLGLAEDISIKPGEQAIFNKESKKLTIENVNTKLITSWKDNKLVLVNMSLQELVILLERKYGVEIEIKNTELLNLHFDGTIKNESIIELLDIIQYALPINYKIIGQKIEITNKN